MKRSVLLILVLLAVIILGLFYYQFSSMNRGYNDENLFKSAEKENTKVKIINEENKISNELTQNKNYDLQIKDFIFSNKELKIKKGDSVTWTNLDSIGHTVTSDSGEELNSNILSINKNYKHIFNKVGTFNYHCTPHPYMKGKIIVE